MVVVVVMVVAGWADCNQCEWVTGKYPDGDAMSAMLHVFYGVPMCLSAPACLLRRGSIGSIEGFGTLVFFLPIWICFLPCLISAAGERKGLVQKKLFGGIWTSF